MRMRYGLRSLGLVAGLALCKSAYAAPPADLDGRVRHLGDRVLVGGNISGDGGLPTFTSLNHPTGVAVDGSGKVFIADTNNQRIRLVAP